MDFKEYQSLALRTARKDATYQDNLVNAALGLAGEAGEVADLVVSLSNPGYVIDTSKLINELGDVMWYVSLLSHTIKIMLDDIMGFHTHGAPPYGNSLSSLVLNLAGETGQIADCVKKYLFQGHEFNAFGCAERLGTTILLVVAILQSIGSTLDEALTGNIKKLEARYPSNSFRAEDSINRGGY